MSKTTIDLKMRRIKKLEAELADTNQNYKDLRKYCDELEEDKKQSWKGSATYWNKRFEEQVIFTNCYQKEVVKLEKRISEAQQLLLPRSLPSFQPILNDVQFDNWAKWLEKLRATVLSVSTDKKEA